MSRSWRRWCTVVSIVLLMLVVFISWYGSPLTRYTMEQQMQNYLENMGYNEKQIREVNIIYDADERYPYIAEITFTSDGEYMRRYCYNSDHEIQFLEQIKQEPIK